LGAIVTTGRFVAFAPHVTRGFYKGNAFSVFNVSGSLSELLARLIHVQKHLSSVDIFLSDSNKIKTIVLEPRSGDISVVPREEKTFAEIRI
jgi:hypothetical protein